MKLRQLIQRIALQRKEEFPFPDNLDAFLDDFIPNELLKSETLQHAFGVTSYEMEELYKEGHAFYEADRYNDSSTVFRWLVLLNPYSAKYWLGLAANQQLLGQYDKALHSYALVTLLDSEDPYPHLHAFECYLALDNLEEALKALECAYVRARGKLEYQDLLSEIEMLKKDENVICNSNLAAGSSS